MVGQTISHYRVAEKLGGGGMGEVEAFWRRRSRQPKSRLPRARRGGSRGAKSERSGDPAFFAGRGIWC